MVTHPIHQRDGLWQGSRRGTAVANAETVKRNDYAAAAATRGAVFTPLCFESYGRWGPAAVVELRRLAKCKALQAEALGMPEPDKIAHAALTRWRQDIACTLMHGNAAVLLAAAPDRLGAVTACIAPHSTAASLVDLLCDK